MIVLSPLHVNDKLAKSELILPIITHKSAISLAVPMSCVLKVIYCTVNLRRCCCIKLLSVTDIHIFEISQF